LRKYDTAINHQRGEVKQLRKLIAIILISMLFLLTSCVPDTPDPPYGVWMSEEPRIVLYFKPEYRIPIGMPSYLGLYTLDGVDTKIFAHFGNGPVFTVYGLEGLSERGGIIGLGIIGGSYRVSGDEIRLMLFQEHVEQFGFSTVIFRLIEDYEPIDPYYWFPQFFPRTENSAP